MYIYTYIYIYIIISYSNSTAIDLSTNKHWKLCTQKKRKPFPQCLAGGVHMRAEALRRILAWDGC